MFNNIFSTYLYHKTFNVDLKSIKKHILKNKKENKGRKVSNYNGWQSLSMSNVDIDLKPLFNLIEQNILELEKNLKYKGHVKLDNFWFNVNGTSSFNRPHIHTHSTISGVFYVTVPKNSGNIVFHSPGLMDLLYPNVDHYNEFTSTTYSCEPKENLCLLFPSDLQHYVEPNLNKKERISISFNYGF
tara:strand:+ start:188 stop:745 length:558 start_codon:yes stop_codon:yes gene_type:complete